jgi:hypothetical protein
LEQAEALSLAQLLARTARFAQSARTLAGMETGDTDPHTVVGDIAQD